MIARLRGRVVARVGRGHRAGRERRRLPRGRDTVGRAPRRRRDHGRDHTDIRADVLQLYGFASAAERELFELLLGVSGVGPKVALGIVSGSTPGGAAAGDRARRPEAVRGDSRRRPQDGAAGRAGAEGQAHGARDGADPDGRDDLTARDALVELGWALVDAERALAELEPDLPVAEQVRQALRAAA